jgi:hypothetical protein
MNSEIQSPRDGEIHPPSANSEPSQAPPDDSAAAAFEALREEVALVRRAVGGLAADRASITIPDYSETLANILQAGAVTARRLKAIAEMPALSATPDQLARQIAAAGETARRGDQLALTEASAVLRNAAQEMKAQLRTARSAKMQRNWLIATGVGGLVAGMVLWAALAGVWARNPPEHRGSPEEKAAAILGMDQVAAGEHLLQTAAPQLWQDLVLGDRIVIANRQALEVCRNKTRKQNARCVIIIPANQP